IDADVYGPDLPLMLGTRGRPGMFDNRIIPVEAHGLKVMSIGLLVGDKEPLVWRGPMIHSFIQQMLRDVMWGPLDYLVFDMPPGTGDAQLSLSQVIPLSGVVMVTTPQDVALLDVRKAIAMFQRLNVPMLPLPDVTFFPRTLLPLHVFEARYRAMVMDALARDRRLCVVKLQPGYEASYAGKPAVHAVSGLGEIVSWERLANGRYNILV